MDSRGILRDHGEGKRKALPRTHEQRAPEPAGNGFVSKLEPRPNTLCRMGVWGAGIFANDLSADVRGEWREALLDGLSEDAATERLLASYRSELDDEDDGPLFWLALASAQAETGRLRPEVRERALAIIDAGDHLRRWEETTSLAKPRAQALDRLAAKLRGPQKPPVALRLPRPRASPLTVGDVVRVRGEDGTSEALFVVVDEADAYPPGSTEPVLATLLWTGGPLPSREEMESLPLVLDDEDGARPALPTLHVVYSPARGKLALANFGDVVTTGIRRADAPDHRGADARHGPPVGHCTWLFLSGWIPGAWFRRCVELTRRVHGVS